jgi:hypothetical protein
MSYVLYKQHVHGRKGTRVGVDPKLGFFRTFRALAKELVRRVDGKVQSLHDRTCFV